MLVNRRIGQVELDIDVEKSNEIYFEESFSERILKQGIVGVEETVKEIYFENNHGHMPLSVFIELTNGCNFSCPFCYINENDNHAVTLPRWSELRQEIDFLIDHGMLYCILSGGECLMYPDFIDLYLYLKRKGVLVTVFTNGYLMTEQVLDVLEQYMPFKIEISIYGIDDVSYEQATGKKHIDSNRVFSNILELKKRGINVVCKTPITSLTETTYPRIMLWCNENKIPFYLGYEMLETYKGHSRSEFEASKSLIERLRQEDNEAFWNSNDMMKMAFREKEEKLQFDCSAGRTEIHISAENQLLPCMKAFGYESWRFDIHGGGIEKAYNDFKHKLMRYKGKALQDCVGCEHHEVCQECFFTVISKGQEKGKIRSEYCKSLHNFCIEGQMRKNVYSTYYI